MIQVRESLVLMAERSENNNAYVSTTPKKVNISEKQELIIQWIQTQEKKIIDVSHLNLSSVHCIFSLRNRPKSAGTIV